MAQQYVGQVIPNQIGLFAIPLEVIHCLPVGTPLSSLEEIGNIVRCNVLNSKLIVSFQAANMYGDVTARPPSLAVRPTHEAYRSMPGTPMGMDGRGSRTMDLAAAMDHSRLGLDGGDYFLGAPRFPAGTLRPRSPMVPVPGQDWDHDHTYSAGGPMNNALGFRERDRERDLEDFIRKENKVAALLNGAILAPAKYAQVYPLRCDDGTFPTDFKSAKTVDTMRTLDSEHPDVPSVSSLPPQKAHIRIRVFHLLQLDRIMQAYRLPIVMNGGTGPNSTSSSRVRQAKLYSLWEFLGAYHILEYEKWTKGLSLDQLAYLPHTRQIFRCLFRKLPSPPLPKKLSALSAQLSTKRRQSARISLEQKRELTLSSGPTELSRWEVVGTAGQEYEDYQLILVVFLRSVSGLVLIFIEVPLLLRICPTSEKFDVFIRRFTTNYMRAGMYGLMSLIQWLSLIRKTTSLIAAAVMLLAAAVCYLLAGLKGQGFVGSKTLGGQGVAQMIV
ncbi:MAG: hypothetical protein L6R39_003615 [Caloplaca ligustica]|nr:MAG: hypothetical protein L6R39_003615 [Caloplaca ligustica]